MYLFLSRHSRAELKNRQRNGSVLEKGEAALLRSPPFGVICVEAGGYLAMYFLPFMM